MPSYRCEIEITGLLPGVTPPEVVPAAEERMARHYRVEDRSVELVAGRPQVHLRFLIPTSNDVQEDLDAERAVLALIDDLADVAVCGKWVLKRGPGRNWRYLTQGMARFAEPD